MMSKSDPESTPNLTPNPVSYIQPMPRPAITVLERVFHPKKAPLRARSHPYSVHLIRLIDRLRRSDPILCSICDAAESFCASAVGIQSYKNVFWTTHNHFIYVTLG